MCVVPAGGVCVCVSTRKADSKYVLCLLGVCVCVSTRKADSKCVLFGGPFAAVIDGYQLFKNDVSLSFLFAIR